MRKEYEKGDFPKNRQEWMSWMRRKSLISKKISNKVKKS